MTRAQVLKKIERKKGQFFKVTFRRKNDKKVNGQVIHKAGEVCEILCRRGVSRFVKGKGQKRAINDIKNNVLTVFNVSHYNSIRKSLGDMKAGQASYRRFDLDNVIRIS